MKYFLTALFLINFFVSNKTMADEARAYDQMKAGKAVLLDIREEEEIKSGMIKGALWLPLSALNNNPTATIKKLKEMVKGKELFLYCRSGNRVKSFISKINDEGIKGQNLGGYEDLISKGLPKKTP